MDCPEPIKIETPELKVKKNRKFKAKDKKGKIIEIEMGITQNSIIFKAEINNDIYVKKYINNYSYDQLKQNNIFIFQENIEEIYEQLEIYTNSEEITCKINDNNIIITLFTKIKKYPEINIELKEEFIDNDSKIKILFEKYKTLEAENKILKTEIENLKNIFNKYINEQKSEIQNLKNQILNINNNRKQINERTKEIQNKFSDSLIVKEGESKMICDWINPGKNINIKAELLYRVSRDGDNPEIFHKYCDNKGPTIIFAKINNGFRFGGFSGISWKSEGGWIKDKDAFLFSLNNKLKFMNNNSKATVYHGYDYGPDFGDNFPQLLLNCKSKCLTGKLNRCSDNKNCFTFKNKDLIGVDVGGQYFFDVEDYEVYSVQIQNK
jgi:hypothetical protein